MTRPEASLAHLTNFGPSPSKERDAALTRYAQLVKYVVARPNRDGQGAAEMPADPNEEDFARRLEKKQTLDALSGAVNELPEREWLIISFYYKDELTMKEIAQVLDISESRVYQLHGRALERLRPPMRHDRAA